jgi:hypothetical protein
MKFIVSITFLGILASLVAAGSWALRISTVPPTADSPAVSSALEHIQAQPPDFTAQLLRIAKDYESYGRVDDETRWAPWLCRMPMPSMARVSESDDDTMHGQKLYYVFAKNRDQYLALSGKHAQPVGQILVKESWRPEQVTLDQPPDTYRDRVTAMSAKEPGQLPNLYLGGSFFPYVKKDGAVYHAQEKSGLYIMMKFDPATPGTDNGWVYGTVTADGQMVTSSGRVGSCMKCHQDAQHDRLFGLPPARYDFR